MALDTLKRIALFVLIGLTQALVFNRMEIVPGVYPLVFVYFVIMFPRSYPRWALLFWSFAMGLLMDVFTNSPGVAAASLTAIGFLQPFLIEFFLPRNADEDIAVSVRELGFSRFLRLAFILVFVFCLLYFSLEAFSVYNWQSWLTSVFGSAVLTIVLIMAFESFRK